MRTANILVNHHNKDLLQLLDDICSRGTGLPAGVFPIWWPVGKLVTLCRVLGRDLFDEILHFLAK